MNSTPYSGWCCCCCCSGARDDDRDNDQRLMQTESTLPPTIPFSQKNHTQHFSLSHSRFPLQRLCRNSHTWWAWCYCCCCWGWWWWRRWWWRGEWWRCSSSLMGFFKIFSNVSLYSTPIRIYTLRRNTFHTLIIALFLLVFLSLQTGQGKARQNPPNGRLQWHEKFCCRMLSAGGSVCHHSESEITRNWRRMEYFITNYRWWRRDVTMRLLLQKT